MILESEYLECSRGDATAEDILTVVDKATPVMNYLEDSDVKVVDGVLNLLWMKRYITV